MYCAVTTMSQAPASLSALMSLPMSSDVKYERYERRRTMWRNEASCILRRDKTVESI